MQSESELFFAFFFLNSIVRFFEQVAEALVQQTSFNLTVETADVTVMGVNVCSVCIQK